MPAALSKRDQRWQGAAVGWCVRRVIRASVVYARVWIRLCEAVPGGSGAYVP